jgi:hypothetical protein
MSAVNEGAADCPAGCAKTPSGYPRPAAIPRRCEAAQLRQTTASGALTALRQFAAASTTLKSRVGRAA